MDSLVVLVDWLTISTRKYDEREVAEIIGLKDAPWKLGVGQNFYQERIEYEGIKIYFNGINEDMGVCLNMSGQACRAYESYGKGDWDYIFDLCKTGDFQCSRIDIAFDDFGGALPLEERMCDDILHGNFRQRMSSYSLLLKNGARTIYNGDSRTGKVCLRIYDKAKEQKRDDIGHWVRCELVLRDKHAQKFITNEGSIGEKYVGVIRNYIAYVTPTEDSNKSRWPLTDYWERFLDEAEPLSVWTKPGTDYSIENLDYAVFTQRGNAIRAELEILGVDGFVEKLKEYKTMPNPKYNDVVEQVKSGKQKKSYPEI